jgi:2-alkenal reductase
MQQQNKSVLLIGAIVLVISLLIGGIGGGIAGYVIARQTAASSSSPAQSGETFQVDPVAVTDTQTNQFAPIVVDQSDSVEAVQKVLPAVVTVLNQSFQGVGSGTGVFIDQSGYLVTNYHVVEGAGELIVIYAKGDRASAQLVGTAPEFDLAVLKVDELVPAVATWGDSGELPLGASVIAIGSALGQYQNTVTAGVLSGFNRDLGPLRGLLQTDAAVNSGNSGGPLINMAGQIIGINTAVVRGGGDGFSAGAEGLSFAIPSNVAETVVQRLIESGDARPSFLGIQYQELNPQLVTERQLTISQGALLEEVVAGSPAAMAGLQVGDVITAINGQPLDERHPLVSLLLEHIAGATITLEVMRNGQSFQTTLTLGERS